MSVLIKGMGMPENCDECPLGEYEDSEWFTCSLMNVACRHIAQCDRLDGCPLVELPEHHGDLIDKHMLWNAIFVTRSGVKIPFIGRDGQAIKIPLANLGQIIKRQPTVLEKE